MKKYITLLAVVLSLIWATDGWCPPPIPGGNATKLQGRSIASTAPTDTYVLTWDAATSTWKPAAAPGAGTGAGTDLQYITYGSEATLSAERVLTESTGIDLSTAIANQIRISVNTTEIGTTTWGSGGASYVWTFNTTGTDPVLTVSDSSFDITTGTLKQAGTKVALGIATSTDNTLVRWDSTGGQQLQTSAITVDDTGNISGIGTLASGAATITGAVVPGAADTYALGSATAEWSDLYLGDGAIIYGQNNQTNNLTSSATGWETSLDLTVAGGDLILISQTAGAGISAGDGTLQLKGLGSGTDEIMTIDLNTNNVITLNSTTSATFTITPDLTVSGLLKTGSGPTTLTDAAGKILSAALNTVGVTQGGTGLATATTGGIYYASATNTIAQLADVAAGQPLLSGGVTTAPAYAGYTFSGTAGQTYTFPSTTATLARTDSANTFTGTQAFAGITASTTIELEGVLTAGTSHTTLTDAAGKILSAALNTVAIAQGGTGQAAAATTSGVVYGASATALGMTAAGAEGQILRAGASPFTPAWTTLTVPATIADGSIFAANAENTLSAVTYHAGGTKVLTNAAGTISWEDAAAPGAHAIVGASHTLAAATAGTILTATAADAFGWTTATYPATVTTGQILYGSATNVVSGLTAGATTEILVGGGAAAPVWTTATGTGAPVRAGSPTFTGDVILPSSNADPATTAGALRHDSTVSNFTNGALVYYNGAAIKQLVDMTTATASACTEGQVVTYDATSDLWKCSNAGAGDFKADGTVAMTGSLDLIATGVKFSASNGVLTILGQGDGADENMTVDFNTTSNNVTFNSGTSATFVFTPAVKVTGILSAGSGPTTITDSAGKILSAALNTVAVAQGGTGATAAATTNGIVYGASGTAYGMTAAGTAQYQVLMTGASPYVPGWSAYTFPATATTGGIIYASATNVYSQLASVAANQPLLSGGVTTAPAYAGYTFSGTPAQTYTFPTSSATLLGNGLTSAYVFVGNGSNVATGVAISGDITITNAGVTAIGADKVKDTMIDWGAAVGQVDLDDIPDSATYQKIIADDVDSAGHVNRFYDSDGTGYITVTGLSTARAITLVDAAQTLVNLASNQTFTGTNTFQAVQYLGDATHAGTLRLYDGSSGYYTTIGTQTMAGNRTFNFPPTNGSSGQALITDGSGNTSWSTSTAGDVLSVGDCTSGACLDGTSDGGTYIDFYSASGATRLQTGTTAGTVTLTLPITTGTLAGLASAQTFTANNTFGDADTDTLTIRSLIVGGNSRGVWIAGSAPTPTYATGTNELYVEGDIETAGTVYGAAFNGGTGSDGSRGITLASNTALTPTGDQLYFINDAFYFSHAGTQKTPMRLEDAQTATGKKTFQGSLAVGDTSNAGSIDIWDGSGNTWTLQGQAIGSNYILVLPNSAGTTGQFLKTTTSGSTATLSWDTPTATAAGSDTQVQFNDGGSALGGDTGLTWNKTTNTLTIGANGQTGTAVLYYEGGSNDYTTTLSPNSAMSSNVVITMPSYTTTVLGSGANTFTGAQTIGSGGSFRLLETGSTPTYYTTVQSGDLTGSDVTITLPATTGTLLGTGAVVTLAQGGSSKNLTAANGGIVYTDTDSMEILAAGTAGQILSSGGAGAPVWIATPTTGALLVGNGTPAWQTFSAGTGVLTMADSTAAWSMTPTLTSLTLSKSTSSAADKTVNITSTNTATTGNTAYSFYNTLASSAVVTGTTQNLYGIFSTATKTGADTNANTTSIYGAFITASNTGATNTGTKDTYGGYFSAAGDSAGTSTSYGIYAVAAGADTNYAGYFSGAVSVQGTAEVQGIVPTSAGGATVGSAALPFSSVYIGNAATNNIQLTGTSAAARSATIPDIAANSTFLVTDATTTTGNLIPLSTTTAGKHTYSSATYPSTATTGGVIYSTGTNAYGQLAKGTAYQVMHMNSGATAPEWTSTLGVTGTRLTAGYFTDLTVTNAISGSVTGTAASLSGSALPASSTIATSLAFGADPADAGTIRLPTGGSLAWEDSTEVTLTHSAGTLTVANANVSLGTSASFTTGTIELGAASDTTIARSAAGRITVESVEVMKGTAGSTASALVKRGADDYTVAASTVTENGTDINAQALNLVTTGAISGGIKIVNVGTGSTTIGSSPATVGTDRVVYGGAIFATSTATIVLPAVVTGMSVCIYSVDAVAKVVDPNASDGIRNGTAARNADGDNISTTGTAGDYVCLLGDSADGWTVFGKSGTWTDQ